MNFKTIKVGRANDNDIVLDHNSVSRNHLEIFFDGEGNVFLTDLESVNGTFVNGKRIIGSVQLSKNDKVCAGLSDSIDWQSSTFDQRATGSFTTVNSTISPLQPVNKIRSSFKLVGITAFIILSLLSVFYFVNEYAFTTPKPVAIDPEKPNETVDQPVAVTEEERKNNPSKKITYDFSCLDDENDLGTTKVVGVLETIDNTMTNAIGGEVSIQKEEEVGEQLLADCKAKYSFIDSGNKIENLRAILSLLVSKIKDKKGYHYAIYLIESEELNAFTAGAKIFITTRMYAFCLSNDELACVIGHEINHNELGHIKQFLQKEKILSSQGAALSQMLTIPFGQKKETHCDLTGIDLVIAAGYNGCANSKLWRRMKEESSEGDYNVLENLLRSHPYSEKRANCSNNHILNNYGFNCDSSN